MAKEVYKPKKQSFFKKNSKTIKLFIIPILAFIAFLSILVILVIPKLQEVFENSNQISTLNSEVADYNTQLSVLDDLYQRNSELYNQLALIDSITPTGDTKIVEYRDRVKALAEENNLTVISEQLSEVVDASLPETAETQVVSTLGLQEVPAIFQFNGSLNDMLEFLKSLDTLPDFVVVKEFEFTLSDKSNIFDFRNEEWALRIQLVKYQFKDTDEELTLYYQNIPASATINQEVKNYLENR